MGDHTVFIATGVAICCAVVGWLFFTRKPAVKVEKPAPQKKEVETILTENKDFSQQVPKSPLQTRKTESPKHSPGPTRKAANSPKSSPKVSRNNAVEAPKSPLQPRKTESPKHSPGPTRKAATNSPKSSPKVSRNNAVEAPKSPLQTRKNESPKVNIDLKRSVSSPAGSLHTQNNNEVKPVPIHITQEFFHSTIVTRQPKPAANPVVTQPIKQQFTTTQFDKPASVFDKPTTNQQTTTQSNQFNRPASVFDKPTINQQPTAQSNQFNRPASVFDKQPLNQQTNYSTGNRPLSVLSPNRPQLNKSVSTPVLNNRPRAAAGTGAGKINALLDWCQECTANYPGVHVENFTKSWQDGKAFMAMVHHFRPDLINFNDASDSSLNNLSIAFSAATKAGIPALLDAEDIVDCPERLSIITYMTEFYRKFGNN